MAYHKISCNTCLSLVSLFYAMDMSQTVREAIVWHLTKCDRCLEAYTHYEHNHPEYSRVGINKIIKDLRKNMNIGTYGSDVKDVTDNITSSFSSDSNTDGDHFNPTKWEDAAVAFDIETLMNLKFFRDLINSYDYSKSHSDLDYSEFYKFVAKKITQKIDLLECCWKKEPVEHIVTNS